MRKRTLAKWTVIAVIAAAGLWLNAKYLNLSPAHIREGVLSFGIFAPLIYIGLLMIRPFCCFLLPFRRQRRPRIRSAVWLFVFFYRCGRRCILSFALAYRLGGYFPAHAAEARQPADAFAEKRLFCILLLRLAPIHFDAVSYAAGVSKVKPLSFALATAAGIIPGTIILNVLGSSLLTGDIIAIAVTAAIYLIFITVPLLFRKSAGAPRLRAHPFYVYFICHPHIHVTDVVRGQTCLKLHLKMIMIQPRFASPSQCGCESAYQDSRSAREDRN